MVGNLVWGDRYFGGREGYDFEKLGRFGLLQTEEASISSHQTLVATLSEEEVAARLTERENARREGDFARDDQIRDDLLKAGVIVEDTKAGTRWKRK